MNASPSLLLSPVVAGCALIALGLIVGGDLLGSRVRDFKRADRYVEVKGLVERTVKSTSASWTLHYSEAGDSLPAVFDASERDKATVLNFFAQQGFGAGDVSVGSIAVSDHSQEQSSAEYRGPRYVVRRSITLHSNDVDRVAAANAHTADLIRAGVILSAADNGGNSGVNFKWDGLNALKPDMITEATRNARASADRFAADSGSKVGEIRNAEQGVFSISAATGESSTGDTPDYSNSADSTIMKKVRVVSTIDYYLTN